MKYVLSIPSWRSVTLFLIETSVLMAVITAGLFAFLPAFRAGV